MSTRVVFDEGGLRMLFESPAGPLGKELKRRGIRVQNRSKQLCAVDTGRLRASITEELAMDSDGLVERIGTDVDYAKHVEFGTSRMRAQPYLRPGLDAAR